MNRLARESLSVGVVSVLIGMLPIAEATAIVPQTGYSVFPAVSQTAGQPTDGQPEARVTFVGRDSTINYIVSDLVRQAHLHPIFTNSPLLGRRIAVHVVDMYVMDALATVLRGTGLEAKRGADATTIIVRKTSESGVTTGLMVGMIAGRVTDSASGQGLGGASVKIAGTKLSTVTSDSGNFTLREVSAGEQVLSVRLFGYKPVDRTVTVVDSQRTMVRIAMVPVPTVLSGVVTTATGVQRKIEVGSDITTLNADSIMRVAPVQTVTDLLESRVPGLTVMHSSGVPGDPSRLRLRGTGSVQLNNDPIVIVNGIRVYASQSDSRNNNLAPLLNGTNSSGSGTPAPSPLDQIDPNSIETIEVMKGPSASAIYGSDAANGVIVITTKHGRTGPTHWSFDVGAGVNWLPGNWPTNYYKFGSTAKGSNNCVWYDATCKVDSVVAFQALNDPRYTVFSHGNDQQATLTVSGGTQTVLYSLTGSGTGDLGNLKLPGSEQARYDSLYGETYGKIPGYLIHPDHYTTWGGSGQLTANPTHQLAVTVQSSLFNSQQQRSPLDNTVVQLEGEYISPVLGTYSPPTIGSPVGSPLLNFEYERITDEQVSENNALTAQWTPREWFLASVTGGVNTIQRNDASYVPFGIYDEAYSVGDPAFAGDTLGYYSIGRANTRDQTLTLATTTQLWQRRVSLSVGGNLHTESTADYSTYTNQLANGVSVPTTFTIAGCTTSTGDVCNSPSTQSTTDQSTYGWYVQPQFNVASRFFVAPGFRLDGGSGAATSAGSVGGLSGFPKMDLSYVMVDRQGGHPLWGFLTLLRPRLAFGFAGTQPGPADKLRLYNVGLANYNLFVPGQGSLTSGTTCTPTLSLDGTSTVQAVCLDALGNTQLRPERSSELEGGFDATLWHGRFQVTYTQYNKTRHDAILAIPVAPSVLSSPENFPLMIEKNIGEIRNTGTEVTVSAQLIQSRDIGWTVGANLSNDNNLVVRLNRGQQPIVLTGGPNGSVQERVEAGYPPFGEFARPISGFYDANGDGIIEANEIVYGDSAVYLGQPNPKYQFNLNSDLALFHGTLTVHADFAYQNGMTQDNIGACSSNAINLLPNTPGTSLATQAAVAASGCGTTNANTIYTPIGLVQTVNTFRFNDLSINYIVPSMVARWFHAPRMSVSLQGSNLGLHTNYRGLDPDVNAFSTVSAGDQTADIGQIPEPRTWWLRLNLGN